MGRKKGILGRKRMEEKNRNDGRMGRGLGKMRGIDEENRRI